MSRIFSEPHPTPQELEDLFTHACHLHENKMQQEALGSYKQLLHILPDSPLLHFNCGLAYFELEQFSDAEHHYLKASELNPNDPDIHYNRGLNLRRLGDIKDAASSFKRALECGDTSVDTLYTLALCHQDMQDHPEAERLYDIILKRYPDHLSTLNNYAYLCHKTGSFEKAEQLYRQLVHYAPEHQAARHMLNSLCGKTSDSAPLEYVESVFDNYAKDFEQSLLVNLNYMTPNRLRKLYNDFFPDTLRECCLDLGCGTGLAGEQFQTCCKKLIGVDISEEMLRVADEKKIYKRLVKDDILHFLQKASDCPDMILAADVFSYMGDLKRIFVECSLNIKQGGLFLFSVEESDSEMFELKTTGRFGHSATYIQKLCQQSGWRILQIDHSKLRKDRGEWIQGYLFIIEKI